MFELIPLLPIPLLILMVILVIMPTVFTIMARISLYQFLFENAQKVDRLLRMGQERGVQPKLLEDLEKRYEAISQQVEQVNTVALIDSQISNESLIIKTIRMNCDQVENLCRSLPNLLLAFGLLGTFWGITSNLYKVGRIIQNVEQTDINRLIQELQPQLQGMSIAFLTSLIALLCSSILIIVNLRFNTGLQKYKLFSYLEDYLDNIYRPSVQGDTRLDKAIDRMVDKQTEFLQRFHENVGAVLEETFGRAALQIVDSNQKANRLAERVYTSFQKSAQVTLQGSEIFKQASFNLNTQIDTLQKITTQFGQDATRIQQGAQSFYTVSENIKKSNFFQKMEEIMGHSSQTQKAFEKSSRVLSKSVSQLISHNQNITNLAEKVYQSFDQSSLQLKNSSDQFIEAASLIQQSELAEAIVLATTEWTGIQNQFSSSTSSLEASANHAEELSQNLNQLALEIHQLCSQVQEVSQASLELQQSSHKLFESQNNAINENQAQLVDSILKLDSKYNEINTSRIQLMDEWSEQVQRQLDLYSDQNQQYLDQNKEENSIAKVRNERLLDIINSMSGWNEKWIALENEIHATKDEFLSLWNKSNNFAEQNQNATELVSESLVNIKERIQEWTESENSFFKIEDQHFQIEQNLQSAIVYLSEKIEELNSSFNKDLSVQKTQVVSEFMTAPEVEETDNETEN